jgi:hypothetical protein
MVILPVALCSRTARTDSSLIATACGDPFMMPSGPSCQLSSSLNPRVRENRSAFARCDEISGDFRDVGAERVVLGGDLFDPGLRSANRQASRRHSGPWLYEIVDVVRGKSPRQRAVPPRCSSRRATSLSGCSGERDGSAWPRLVRRRVRRKAQVHPAAAYSYAGPVIEVPFGLTAMKRHRLGEVGKEVALVVNGSHPLQTIEPAASETSSRVPSGL